MSDRSPQDKTGKDGKPLASTGRWPRRLVPLVIACVAVAVVVIIIAAVKPRNRNTPPAPAPPVNVKVMTVTAEPELADTFDLPAVVEPNRIVRLAAEVAGRVERITAKEGSAVRAGDLLIQLNTDLLKAEFDSADAQTKYDRIERERQQGLVKDGAAPPRDLETAATRLAVSEARLEDVGARLKRTSILAPISGLLNDVLVEQGEYVQAGTSVAEVVDTDTVKVVVDIPERDIAYFAVGGSAQTFADVKGEERSLNGTITYISQLAHPQTRSTRMEITMSNADSGTPVGLHSGQIVRVRLTRRVLKQVVMVPLLAVIPMEDGKAVYVVNSSQAHRREVQLGMIRGDRVQIVQGLQPGDRLIIEGHRFVAPGQQVNVVPDNQ